MKLEWDRQSDRVTEGGVQQGVIYPKATTCNVWNGLVDVTTKRAETGFETLYYEGVPYDVSSERWAFAGKISAYTYPEVLDEIVGYKKNFVGVMYDGGEADYFDISYKTRVGGSSRYKIHVVLNLRAIPQDTTYKTIGANYEPTLFAWEFISIPRRIGENYISHLIFDSEEVPSKFMESIEKFLYGTDNYDPSMDDFINYLNAVNDRVGKFDIVDNGDGTFTADVDEDVLYYFDDYFEFYNARARYLNTHTYEMEARKN